MIYTLLLLIAQVVLEVFPISSSGHFRLIELFFASSLGGEALLLPAHFDHFLHGPMILILLVFFRRRWYPFLSHVVGALNNLRQPVVATDVSVEVGLRVRDVALVKKFFHLIGALFLADSVTVGMYGIVKYLEKKQIVTNSPASLLLGFFMTMLILLLLRFKIGMRAINGPWITPSELSYKQIMLLGFAQGVGLFPGISRFACTYVLGSCLGLPQKTAFELSFLLLFPLIVAGFFVNGLPALWHIPAHSPIFTVQFWFLLVLCTLLAYAFFSHVYRIALRNQLWYFSLYMLFPLTLLSWFIVTQ